MKIKKFQEPPGPFTNLIDKNGLTTQDFFNNVIRNENGRGLYRFYLWEQNANKKWFPIEGIYGSNDSPLKNGLYRPITKGSTSDIRNLEQLDFYKNNIKYRIDSSGNLTDAGKAWLDAMIEYLPEGNETRRLYQIIKDNNYQFKDPFNIKGINYNSILSIFETPEGRLFDGQQGQHHTTIAPEANIYTPQFEFFDVIFNDKNRNTAIKFNPLMYFLDAKPLKDTLGYRRVRTSNGSIVKELPFKNNEAIAFPYTKDDISELETDAEEKEKELSLIREWVEKGIAQGSTGSDRGVLKNDRGVLKVERPVPSTNRSRFGTFWSNLKSSVNNLERSPFLELALRIFADNIHNTWNTNKYARELTAPLSTYTPSYREVYGDYNALMLGEQLAARLRNQRPLTSNAEVQGALDQEAIAKGNLAIQLGNLLDTLMFRQTSERAWLQYKENNQGWNTVANANSLALSKLINTRAELRYNARALNMSNIDTLLADREKRRWLEYDELRAEKRAGEKAIKNLELNNLLYPEDYRLKMAEWADLNTRRTLGALTKAEEERLAELSVWRRRAEPVQFYQKMYNLARQYGANYTLPSGFKVTDGRVDYEKDPLYNKLGGKLLAKGGLVSAASSFVAPATYSEKKSASSKSSDSASEEEKEELKLKKEIAETLKGIKGNPSDVAKLSGYLSSFFAQQQYNPVSGLNDLYTGYITALNLVNQINSSSKTFDDLYKRMDKEGSLNSPAMDSNGNVYVGVAGTGKIDRVRPEEYLEDMKKPVELRKYQLLYNSTLLSLRKDDSRFAFLDQIMFDAASNGVSMENINKYIKDIIGDLGTDDQSMDRLVRAMGPQGVQGLQTLVLLALQGISNAETNQIIASLNSLTELNLTTKTLENLAKLAIASIGAMLPPNMRTTLLLLAGNEENLEKLITALVFKNLDATVKFNIRDFNTVDENGNIVGSKSKGSSGGEPKEELLDLFLKQLQKGNGGEKETITINPGTKSQLSVIGTNYYVGEAGTLADMLKSTTIKGLADPRKIYFGDLLIDPAYLEDVAFLNRGVTRVILPIKRDGSPDFTIFDRFEKVCDKVRQKGYEPFGETDDERKKLAQELLAKELQAEGLYDLCNNGLPDVSKVGLFVLADCLTSEVAGVHASNFVAEVKDPDWDKFKSLLSKKGPDGKYREYDKIDEFDWWNPADYHSSWRSHLYQGTVYIPISNNELLASIVAGNKIKDSTAYGYEGNAQRWETIVKSGRNPEENSSDKLNINETE